MVGEGTIPQGVTDSDNLLYLFPGLAFALLPLCLFFIIFLKNQVNLLSFKKLTFFGYVHRELLLSHYQAIIGLLLYLIALQEGLRENRKQVKHMRELARKAVNEPWLRAQILELNRSGFKFLLNHRCTVHDKSLQSCPTP